MKNNRTPLWWRLGLRLAALLGGLAAVYGSNGVEGIIGTLAGLVGVLLVIGALIGD